MIAKTFTIVHNVGRAKYVANFHDGVKAHDDGSPFFDVRIFTNKKALARFTREMLQIGYQRQ